jgi:hypothetical protein
MRLPFMLLLALLALARLAGEAHAADIPNAQVCMVPLGLFGKSVRARERVGPSPFVTQASWGNGGWPTIIYSPAYFRLLPAMQAFLSLHECGHLVLKTMNEYWANCYAVANGHWSAADLDLIRQSHEAAGQAGSQYGGSGAALWVGTKRTCPQYFEAASSRLRLAGTPQ